MTIQQLGISLPGRYSVSESIITIKMECQLDLMVCPTKILEVNKSIDLDNTVECKVFWKGTIVDQSGEKDFGHQNWVVQSGC